MRGTRFNTEVGEEGDIGMTNITVLEGEEGGIIKGREGNTYT
jgi:hypothetical protein